VVRRLLDQIEAPAIVSSVHGDYLAANALGRALYAPVFESSEQPANSARFTFLDPAARDFYPDWERLASELVATLRSQAGRNPYDRGLQDLIGELSTRSDEFRVRWAAHNVRFHRTGTKRLRHPIVGELELSYETLTLDADDGLRLALYTAEPDSTSQQALDLLHQPVPTDFESTIGAHKAAEKMLADGRARAIGVSNFSPEHLRRLIDRTDVVPAVNQVELHPYFTQPALREVHAELGIVTQAWSPLGGVLVYVPAHRRSSDR
jgi:hypothetical protein